MKKTLIAMGVLGAFSSLAFAASNVTLYGIIEEGVIVHLSLTPKSLGPQSAFGFN